MYNMGIEGQVFLGAFTAALAGYMIKGVPTALHVTLCLLIGAAFGAVYALIPGLLKAKLRVNEVVTTVIGTADKSVRRKPAPSVRCAQSRKL